MTSFGTSTGGRSHWPVPRLRTSSPLAGLRRRTLGTWEITGQSVAVTAPSAAMASTPMLVASTAGNGTMYSYMIGTAVVLLVGYCVSQFASRMVAAGSLYSFTAKGLGPTMAVASGFGLVIGYGLLAMATLLLSSLYLIAFLEGLGVRSGAMTVALLVLALGALAIAALVRGIRLSARVGLVVEAVSIGGILTVLAVLLARGKAPLDMNVFHPAGAAGQGVGLGVALAITGFIGFESAAAVGVEARRPHVSVPRAILRTALGAGGLYLLSAYTQLAGFANTPGGLAASNAPLSDLAARADVPWLSTVVDLGIATSGFGCATAAVTALARLLLSMAREGVVLPELGRTHPRLGTPHVAIVSSLTVIVTIPVLLLAGGMAPWHAFSYLVTISTFGYMLAYVLVCVALPRFLHRIGELTAPPLLAGITAAAVLCYTFAAYIYPSQIAPFDGLLWTFVGLLLAVMAWYAVLIRRDPSRAKLIGVYDEPVIGDLFDPTKVGAG